MRRSIQTLNYGMPTEVRMNESDKFIQLLAKKHPALTRLYVVILGLSQDSTIQRHSILYVTKQMNLNLVE